MTKYDTWSKSKIPLVNSGKDGISLAYNLEIDTDEISKFDYPDIKMENSGNYFRVYKKHTYEK